MPGERFSLSDDVRTSDALRFASAVLGADGSALSFDVRSATAEAAGALSCLTVTGGVVAVFATSASGRRRGAVSVIMGVSRTFVKSPAFRAVRGFSAVAGAPGAVTLSRRN